jgi:hypothetical protein
LLVAVYLAVTTYNVANGPQGIHINSVGSLYAGIKKTHRDWIDRAVGRDADVSVIWSGVNAYTVWENEFFSRSIHKVYDLSGPSPGGLPETALHQVNDGRLADPAGNVVEVQYALAAEQADVEGKVVASDPRNGLNLVRVDGPLVLQTHVSGIYPDAWSGRHFGYTRYDCTGGKLSVVLQSDAHLFTNDQVVTATTGAKVLGAAHVAPIGERRLTVPLVPAADHSCRVVFTSANLRSPAKVKPGSTDTRELGVRVLNFVFRP